jgi:putative membrane protein
MTTVETPPPAAPAPGPQHPRRGFYVAPWILAVLGGLALLVIGFVLGRAVDRHHDRNGPFFRGGDDPGAPRGLRILVLLLVVALVVVAVVALVRHFSRRDAATTTAVAPPMNASTTTAEQVLADRFARGEIDEAEFVSRRDVLRS